MGFRQDFEPLALSELHGFAESRRAEGWRYVQTLAVLTEEGVDLVYSFMKDGHLANSVVSIGRDAVVPSISDLFLAAFVFENEIHDLFGIAFEGLRRPGGRGRPGGQAGRHGSREGGEGPRSHGGQGQEGGRRQGR